MTSRRVVVLAPDSFKGSLRAADVARAIEQGWASERPSDDLRLLPMADGGEGTLDAFATAIPASTHHPVTVTGPDGMPTAAAWLLLPPTADAPNGTAVVELALASGIELLGERRLPWDAHTLGFGQVMAAALDSGVSRLVLGIGSSASTDGGTGMLTALGARLTDAEGRPIPLGARGLADVASVDLSNMRPAPEGGVLVLTDVTSPLLGPRGAAAVFGPQKGLDTSAVARVDAGLAQWAALVPAEPSTPGAGAAGGTGFALLAWGARLVPGAAEVATLVGLPAAIASADLVVTGEGGFDGQSAQGKAPVHVANVAAAARVPVALVAGQVASGADVTGFARAVSLAELAGSAQAAIADPTRWLRDAGVALARLPLG